MADSGSEVRSACVLITVLWYVFNPCLQAPRLSDLASYKAYLQAGTNYTGFTHADSWEDLGSHYKPITWHSGLHTIITNSSSSRQS